MASKHTANSFIKYYRWSTSEIFFILSIFVAVIFGIYGSEIQKHNHISTTELSIISGTFFIMFSISQFLSGILIYKIPPKLYLCVSALISALGCIVFASTSTFALLILSRVLLGLGLGSAFLAVIYTVQANFPEEKFVFFTSLSQCVANIFLGCLSLFSSSFLSDHSYQFAFIVLAVMLIITAFLLAISFRTNNHITSINIHENQNHINIFQLLKELFSHKHFWFAALFFTGLFSSLLTFSDLFNVSYQMETFNISHENAIRLNGMIPIGVAIGSLLSGYLSAKYHRNELTSIIFSGLALLAIIFILYIPLPETYRLEVSYITNLLFGIGCGSAMLAFEEMRLTVKGLKQRMLANSLILTIAYLFNGLLLQPLIGFVIDQTTKNMTEYYPLFSANYMRWLYDNSVHIVWHKYNNGLTLITIGLIISFISSIFFTRKTLKFRR